MQPVKLSQRDPRWKDQQLGESSLTIGVAGCTITAFAMKFGLTPDVVNAEMKTKGGFVAPQQNPTQKNLVLWTKLPEIFPGVVFNYRYNYWDERIVNANLPCLVEVNAAPIGGTRHWVLYIGNGRLFDPWDGQEKPVQSYAPISFVVLTGEYKQAVMNPVPGDTATVVTPEYIKQIEADRIMFWKQRDAALEQVETLKKQLESQTPNQVEDPRYTELKARGYASIEDVTKALNGTTDDCKEIKKKLIDVLEENEMLHKMHSDQDRMDNEALKQSINAIEENKELKETLAEVVKSVGADKPTKKSIMEKIFFFREKAEMNIKRLEKNQATETSVPSKSKEKKMGVMDYLIHFLTPPSSEGVSK